jgi:hypothetical protein
MRKNVQLSIGIMALLLACGAAAQAQSRDINEHVIIDTPKPYASVVASIQNLVGKVTRQFQYIDAISADIPSSAMPALRDLVGEDAVSRDNIIQGSRPVLVPRKSPRPIQRHLYERPRRRIRRAYISCEGARTGSPENAYAVNNANLKMRDLHNAGYTGRAL